MKEGQTGRSIAIVVASVGRPVELGRWREHVARQTLKPAEMIWSVTGDDDLPPPVATAEEAVAPRIIYAPAGSASQRNAALDMLESLGRATEVIAFFDDDYVPASTCLDDVMTAFDALPDAVGLTGTLLADGIRGEGLLWEEARMMIADYDRGRAAGRPAVSFEAWEGLYGCNMALRSHVVGRERFDERLPLYGWQEDVDFAIRVARGRPLGRTNAFVGVHQGIKRGRTSGRRFGYSQVANPVYLYTKGSIGARKLADLVGRNLLSNHGRMFRPEPWVDRRGRVVGNWLALLDVLRGRITPERILDL